MANQNIHQHDVVHIVIENPQSSNTGGYRRIILRMIDGSEMSITAFSNRATAPACFKDFNELEDLVSA